MANGRMLEHYPELGVRRSYLALVVLITVALYYALYIVGGVAPLFMPELHMSFSYLVGFLAISNLLGAFASLLAGVGDRGRRRPRCGWGGLGLDDRRFSNGQAGHGSLFLFALLRSSALPFGCPQARLLRKW